VVVATLVDEAREPPGLAEMTRWCREVRVVPRVPTRGPHPIRLFAFRKYYVAEMTRAVRELESRHGFDVVHLDYTQMGVYADAVPRRVPRGLVEGDVSFVTVGRGARPARGARGPPAPGRAAPPPPAGPLPARGGAPGLPPAR